MQVIYLGSDLRNKREGGRSEEGKEEKAMKGAFTALGLNPAGDPLKSHVEYASNYASEG